MALVLTCGLALAVAGCSEKSDVSSKPRSERVDPFAGRDFVWSSVDGADAYRVQGWAAGRILFDEVAREPRLATTPSLERTLAAFDAVQLRIQALDADGEDLGPPVEFDAKAARDPAPAMGK